MPTLSFETQNAWERWGNSFERLPNSKVRNPDECDLYHDMVDELKLQAWTAWNKGRNKALKELHNKILELKETKSNETKKEKTFAIVRGGVLKEARFNSKEEAKNYVSKAYEKNTTNKIYIVEIVCTMTPSITWEEI